MTRKLALLAALLAAATVGGCAVYEPYPPVAYAAPGYYPPPAVVVAPGWGGYHGGYHGRPWR